jgi:hypothetical protein
MDGDRPAQIPTSPLWLTLDARNGTITAVVTEPPGGTVGCDVCGVLLDASKASVHDAWHQKEEERLNQLLEMVQELVRVLPGSRS